MQVYIGDTYMPPPVSKSDMAHTLWKKEQKFQQESHSFYKISSTFLFQNNTAYGRHVR
jgi:hypothetical protein